MMKIKANNVNSQAWKDVYFHAKLPKELEPLHEIAVNLWWVWNYESAKLFGRIDKNLWRETEGNPVLLLQNLTHSRIEEILADKELMARINKVHAKFKAYVNTAPDRTKPSIAYFSMEYGLTNVLKIYSGGLGVLAGDYLKEASDSNIDLCAVGFLYRHGYFTQSLTVDGQQVANYEAQDFNSLPLVQVFEPDGSPMLLEVPLPERKIYARIWKVTVGRIPLYLMDTDISENAEWDRSITHQLYGGDWENRMKQEYLLGVGGIMLLDKLGIKKQVYHCNEGHAALINAQRLANYIQKEGLAFNQALEVVRASSLYTVHTPVPAGHDYFDEELFRRYTGDFPAKLGISWQDFIDMGRENPGSHEKFSMSVFALNTCQEANAVSWMHGQVSKKMFAPVWKGYFPEELHVGYVTNGVHLPTWAATETKRFFAEKFNDNFFNSQSNRKYWEEIYNVPDVEVWELRKALKRKLINYVRSQYTGNWLKSESDPSKMVSVLDKMNTNALLIGFGRRFATYKRAHLLFNDLDRLAKIVNNEKFPVQFIYTGKAHPADGGGQGLIKHIVEISRRPEFLGKIIFLENYDMRLARRLVAGVDVWLNTPTRPLEASGTSGEKAQMNGVLNFSVLDGWWYEGYKEGAGWALTDKSTYASQQFQDQLDATTIYDLLEREIIPAFFDINPSGYSDKWVKYIKNSFAKIAPDYTMKRMIDDYIERFYSKLATRHTRLAEGNYAKAKEIAAWKEEVAEHWDSFEVETIGCEPDFYREGSIVGREYTHKVVIDRKDLKGTLGIDRVIAKEDPENHSLKVVRINEFELVKEEGSKLYFELRSIPNEAGHLKIGYRVYPKNSELPHRMDFAYVRWIK
ncbi:Maltodextrin phosphorylase [Bacteroidales bacterium Barb6XT]|nr:Maltodextrin phosphorylase [Bacteroidales bacterium Barb6XT]